MRDRTKRATIITPRATARRASRRANGDGHARKPDVPKDQPTAELRHQDAFEFLKELVPGSVDLIVSSPPYFVGKEYDRSASIDDFVADHKRLAPLLVRALKDGGSLSSSPFSPRTVYRPGRTNSFEAARARSSSAISPPPSSQRWSRVRSGRATLIEMRARQFSPTLICGLAMSRRWRRPPPRMSQQPPPICDALTLPFVRRTPSTWHWHRDWALRWRASMKQ